MYKELDWKLMAVVWATDGIVIEGVNLWNHKWIDLKESFEVSHPAHPWEKHTVDVYRVEADCAVVVFAAGEFSPGVWGFYVPGE